jgi:hypothetical protein
MDNLNEYKKRFYTLMESTMGNVKPLINEQKADYSSIYGKTVTFTPVKVVNSTRINPDDPHTESAPAYNDILNILKTDKLKGTIIDNSSNQTEYGNGHSIGVDLDPNLRISSYLNDSTLMSMGVGSTKHIFSLDCDKDIFTVVFTFLDDYNTDFNNGGVDFLKFEVDYKCDGLKDILKNMYPCKTDLSKVDNSPSPISDTLS